MMRIKSRVPFAFVSPAPARHARRRIGFTLVEMIAVMSTLLLLGIAATTMLANVTEIGLRHRRAMEERSSVLRFAEAFRDDVDGSIDVVAQTESWPVTIIRANEVIEYDWNASTRGLFRIARSKNGQGDTEAIASTDLFPLTDRSDPRFEIEDARVRVLLREPGPQGAWIVEANR